MIAFVGFAFSGQSKVAAEFATQNKVTYFSPAASLDELFEGGYAKSFGISMSKTAKEAAKWIKKNYPKSEISFPPD